MLFTILRSFYDVSDLEYETRKTGTFWFNFNGGKVFTAKSQIDFASLKLKYYSTPSK